MVWTVQKVADFGTSNPIVARVLLQTTEISKVTSLSRDERESLFEACNDLSRRLINATEAAKEVRRQTDQGIAVLNKIAQKGHGETVELPWVTNLDIISEGFFYNAKNVIRDLGRVTKVLYGHRFDEASDWCAFGKKTESEVSKVFRRLSVANPGFSAIRELLEQSRPSIEMIVRIRNALEHPGKAAGTVQINNFRLLGNGTQAPSLLFVEDDQLYDLAATLDEVPKVLLDVVETTIVWGLMPKLGDRKLGLQRIKEDERNPSAPVAYQVVRITPEMERQGKPFDGRKLADRNVSPVD